MKRLLQASGWMLISLAWPVLIWAQESQKEFVPADTIAKQEVPAEPLLYGAYAFVWAALLVYVLILWRRIGRVERELRDVNRKLEKR